MANLILPHKYPLNFAKKVVESTKNTKKVLCQFESLPTISMLLEAAAQSTVSFCKSKQTKGVLIKANNIELLRPIYNMTYICQIQILCDINNWSKYNFEVFDKAEKVCTGSILIGVD
jgi:CRISPR/Cas system CMR-associated protein Cmr5 small subunit